MWVEETRRTSQKAYDEAVERIHRESQEEMGIEPEDDNSYETEDRLSDIFDDVEGTVYIGKTGNKYHSQYCRTLKGGGMLGIDEFSWFFAFTYWVSGALFTSIFYGIYEILSNQEQILQNQYTISNQAASIEEKVDK